MGEALAVDDALLGWADALDHPAEKEPFAKRPVPMPNAEQRLVSLSVTDFDQLKSDP
jgi:hypothetical protein